MPLTNEVKQMQQQGQSDSEISATLKGRGLSDKDISTALSQAEIKQAVAGPSDSTLPPAPSTQSTPAPASAPAPASQQISPPEKNSMQPSMLDGPSQSAPRQAQQEQYEAPPAPQQAQQEQYESPQQQQQYDAYPAPQQGQPAQPYQSYAPSSSSSDVVTEISEQVVAEALGPLKRKLEKNIDLKSSFETKLSNLDDRLKSIEKIIDRLQLSILQKVGESMSNIDDIKTELLETQKTIKSHHKSRKKK